MRWIRTVRVGLLTALIGATAPSTMTNGAGSIDEIAQVANLGTDSPSPATRLDTARSVQGPAITSSDRLIGYATSWGIYDRQFEIADIPADKLTHVNYAFANVVDGRCVIGDRWADVERPLPTDDRNLGYRGNFNQLQVLKRQHPHLRTLISVGGATWSEGFSQAASTPERRQTFVTSCLDLMSRYGFDGIDVDWEFPTSSGAVGGDDHSANYLSLLTELRAGIDSATRAVEEKPLLTVAGPAGAPAMAELDIAALVPIVDWVNVMTYDFAGDWSPQTGHNSPLHPYEGIEDPTFTVESALRRWESAGMPAHKLMAGLPFYGRGFSGVADPSPGSAYSAVPFGTTQAGQYDFADLVSDELRTMDVRFDDAAMVPFAYDPSTGVWISYDNARSIEEKARHVDRNGYGGVMIWELSNDSDGALLRAARRGLDS